MIMDIPMLLGLIVFALIYGVGIRRLRSVQLREIAAFAAGWTILAVALASPLEEWAERSLTAHMIQHELLMVAAAPLLALGRVDFIVLALTPRRRRRTATWWLRMFRVNAPAAWALHAVALWAWHVPALFEAALATPLLHAAEHLSFLATALLFWWAVLDRRLGYGAAALYVFATSLHKNLLGALLFLSPRVWYPSYGSGAAALEDQQLAGLVMWVPGGVVLAATALFLVFRWLEESERRVVARERLALLRAPRPLCAAGLLLGSALALAACNDARATASALTGGDPDAGREKIQKYGCWTCHTIPGIPGANAAVGPPLDGLGGRAYVAGRPNSPKNLLEWIQKPQSVRSPTPMPDMGVTEADARDIAAYLYTLR
jgi:cytochrome c oxidase assembly factor CtaG/cytochrome c2